MEAQTVICQQDKSGGFGCVNTDKKAVVIPFEHNTIEITEKNENTKQIELFLAEIKGLKQGKFSQYVEMGKQMDKRRILSLLIDMYMKYCGISLGYRTVVYDLGWAVFTQFVKNEETEFTGEESFCKVMPKLHPEYTEEYDKYDVCLLEDKNYPNLCMEILEEYAEQCVEQRAAICYGLHCMLVLNPLQKDKEDIWTTKKLLYLILHYKKIQSKYPEDVDFLKHLQEKIIAVLKAFDMYVETVVVFLITKKKKSIFRIDDLFEGNFLSKRSASEIYALLQELADLIDKKLFLKLQREYDKGKLSVHELYHIIGDIFEEFLNYRSDLPCEIFFINYTGKRWMKHIARKLLWKHWGKKVDIYKEQIDTVLLKIMGEKEPISRRELKEKYAFPEPQKRGKEDNTQSSKRYYAYKIQWFNENETYLLDRYEK